MLKKQTVWLLTMLSLMIVLSVYYLTSPEGHDTAFVNNGEEQSEDSQSTTSDGAESDSAQVEGIANTTGDELFTTLRMEIQDMRSTKIEQLEDIVASSSASTAEINKALNDIDKIKQRSTKEAMLEESILAAADYEDVLVRYDDSEMDKVHVKVKAAEKLSKKETLNIMQMVYDEFGEVPVVVDNQPTAGDSNEASSEDASKESTGDANENQN